MLLAADEAYYEKVAASFRAGGMLFLMAAKTTTNYLLGECQVVIADKECVTDSAQSQDCNTESMIYKITRCHSVRDLITLQTIISNGK